MKIYCSECGYSSSTTFKEGICPVCKKDNSKNDYRKGDKYHVLIEGGEQYYRYVDEVIDHIECSVHFEVDSQALRFDLKNLNKYETIELRYDCIVQRIA